MCGLAAYVGKEDGRAFLWDALTKLESRGYDSFGLGWLHEGYSRYVRRVGAVDSFRKQRKTLLPNPIHVGMAHTRWATHGAITEENAHPIPCGNVLVAHNGVVSNAKTWVKLRQIYKWTSDTDTETIGWLWHEEFDGPQGEPFYRRVANVCSQLEGQYAFLIIDPARWPGLIGACKGSPLLIANNSMVASDAYAFSGHAFKCHRLPEGSIFFLREGELSLYDFQGNELTLDDCVETEVPTSITLQRYKRPHMQVEIAEQIHLTKKPLGFEGKFPHCQDKPEHLYLFGCGSSYHAALMGKRYFEEISGIPTQVEYASEVPEVVRSPERTFFLALTQSGETKDTCRVIQQLHQDGQADLFVLTNRGDSLCTTLATPILIGAGMEKGVAATKTFTLSCIRMLELALMWATYDDRRRFDQGDTLSKTLRRLILCAAPARQMAEKLNEYRHVLLLGSGHDYPIALEGALKLKEVAYLHAEALPAAEVKHGPIALIDDDVLTITLISSMGGNLKRTLSNLEQIRARGGRIFSVCLEGLAKRLKGIADFIVEVPAVEPPHLHPLAVNAVLQNVAYFLGLLRGHSVDRPRSISKVISVE